MKLTHLIILFAIIYTVLSAPVVWCMIAEANHNFTDSDVSCVDDCLDSLDTTTPATNAVIKETK